MRIEQLEQTVLEQFGMSPDDLIAEYGPDNQLPPTDLEMAEYEQAKERGEQVFAPAPMPYDRPTQERRAKRAERELAELGRVNPLALEEFAALEERYNFLSTQLEDVKAARKDLLDVVADVDARILQVFSEAFVDVEREFREVFTVLFPGGEGRLRLTDPDNMLTTGIEVEARPPGKKVTRLSLLSGWREGADGGGDAGGDLPRPPVAVLHHGRGGGRARRHQPAPPDQSCSSCCGPGRS